MSLQASGGRGRAAFGVLRASAMVLLWLAGGACDIPVPDNVFTCRERADCPDGFVCKEQRCRAHASTTSPPQGISSGSGGAAGRTGAAGEQSAGSGGSAGGPAVPVDACRGKAPGAQVCDDGGVGQCSDDLTQLEHLRDCGERAHCADSAGDVDCACDLGFAKDKAGNCQNVNDCPKGACTPGGHCLDRLNDYECACDKGYEVVDHKACKEKDECAANPCGAGTTGCVDRLNDFTCTCKDGYAPSGKTVCSDRNECEEVNACTASYPCTDGDGDYFCSGQFLRTAMPDLTPEAARHPNYSPETETVYDSVTLLHWQKTLPATYAGCTRMITAAGDACSWDEARIYCDELILAGYTEWRLPSKIELESLLDLTAVGSANPSIFPNAPALTFWTSSPYSLMVEPADPRHYWYVDFAQGWSYHGSSMWDFSKVRCVK